MAEPMRKKPNIFNHIISWLMFVMTVGGFAVALGVFMGIMYQAFMFGWNLVMGVI